MYICLHILGRLFVTDGDDNLYFPLILEINDRNSPWCHSKFILCRFHRFFVSWKKFIGSPSGDATKVIKEVYSMCQYALYRAETVEEFQSIIKEAQERVNVAKSLIGDALQATMIEYLTRLLSDSHLIGYHNTIFINGFNMYTTNCVEQQNSALKGRKNCHSTRATHGIDNAFDVITQKVDNRSNIRETAYTRVLGKTHSLASSSLPGIELLTPYAIDVVTKQWEKRHNYYVVADSATTFLVMAKDAGTNTIRVRTVIVSVPTSSDNDDPCSKVLTCSCGFFQRMTATCGHIYAITDQFDIKNIGIRWFLLYYLKFGRDAALTESFLNDSRSLETGPLVKLIRGSETYPQLLRGTTAADYAKMKTCCEKSPLADRATHIINMTESTRALHQMVKNKNSSQSIYHESISRVSSSHD